MDDVMAAGTVVRQAIESIQAAGGDAIGVIQLLDREERGKGGGSMIERVSSVATDACCLCSR